MPPRHTPLLQQATPSQSQPQPHGSSCPHAPSQSCRCCHQAAIINVPESGEEFNFISVEHEDTSAICSNVATVNSTPLPSVQAQPVDLLAHKGSSRDVVDINHFFLEGNAACYGTASCLLSYLINHASPILSNELSNTSVWML